VLWWERAVDLSRVLDRMRDDPVFGSVIDVERASVAGFSIGAYAALATVGARLRIERWRPHCDMHPDSSLCRVPPEAGFPIEQVWDFLDTDPVAIESLSRADLNYRDPRFIAAVAIAPVAVPLLDEDSVTEIVAPVLLVGASNDDQSRLDTDVHPLRRAIPHSELTVIDGAGHYTFLSEGTLAGRLLAPRFVRDPRGVRRREVHDRVAREALRVLA
jgi:predicted dienelactone hydrolase